MSGIRNVGSIPNFTVAAGSFVVTNTPLVATNLVLQGDTTGGGTWATIPVTEYEVFPVSGYIAQRWKDRTAGTDVDWSVYSAFRLSAYAKLVSGTRTAYTNQTITFADESRPYSPIGQVGEINGEAMSGVVAAYLNAGGSNVIADDTGLRLRALSSLGTSYIGWKTDDNVTIGEIYAGYAGGYGTLVMIGRGHDATDPTGVAKLQANKYDNSVNTALAIASYGSITYTGTDGVATQLPGLYSKDFGGGTTVQGTTTETTIYTMTVGANQMSSAGILTMELGGDLKNNSGLTPNLTFRVKFGGNLVATLKVSNVTSFSGVGGYFIRVRLANDGNTNAQRCFAMLVASKNGTWDGTSADYGTSSVDTTSNAVCLITAQWSTAGGSPESPGVFSKGGLVELTRTN